MGNGAVKCWGLNPFGQLGQGDTASRGDAAGEMGDALLPVDLGSGGAGGVSDTVTDAVSTSPVAGAFVVVMRTTDFSIVGGIVADGAGNFTVGVDPGSYVAYIDPTGNHPTRFFPSAPDVPSATPVAVTAGGTTTANGSLPTQVPVGLGFNLTGNVTSEGSGFPLSSGVFVLALRASDFALARGVFTNTGSYNLDVAPGQYKLAFIDPSGLHNGEWHNNQPLSNLAGAASVTAPAITIAALGPNVGTMSGTVTDDPSLAPVADAWVLAIGPISITAATDTTVNAGLALP